MGDLEDELCAIETESAADAMDSIWHDTAPLGSLAAISNHCTRGILHLPGPPATLFRGDAVEIRGGPASGKTALLQSLVLACITPSNFPSSESHANGWGKGAVVFDCDSRWNPCQLRTLLKHHLHTCSGGPPDQDLDSVVALCLRRVHIFRPSSPLALACTLQGFETYISTRMSNQVLGIVLLDSVSAFYWESKYVTETGVPGLNELQVALSKLHQLRLKYRPLVLVSSWGLPSQEGGRELSTLTQSEKEYLQRPIAPSSSSSISSIEFTRTSTLMAQLHLRPSSSWLATVQQTQGLELEHSRGM